MPIGKNSYCYRVRWNKYDLVTIEPKTIVTKAYQELVEEFEGKNYFGIILNKAILKRYWQNLFYLAAKKSKKTKKKNVNKNKDEKLLKPDLLEHAAKHNVINDDVDEFDLSLVVESKLIFYNDCSLFLCN